LIQYFTRLEFLQAATFENTDECNGLGHELARSFIGGCFVFAALGIAWPNLVSGPTLSRNGRAKESKGVCHLGAALIEWV